MKLGNSYKSKLDDDLCIRKQSLFANQQLIIPKKRR